MRNKKLDLTRTLVVVLAVIGLAGLGGSLITHADLSIGSNFTNAVQTIQSLRITADGTAGSSDKVRLDSGGVYIDSGALGGVPNGVLKTNSAGYVTRGLVSGSDIASGSITNVNIASGTIQIWNLGFTVGSGSSGAVDVSCPTWDVMIGVSGGVATCGADASMLSGACSGSGAVIGWTSTGAVMCSNDGGGGFTGLGLGGGASLWHQLSGTFDIYYGTFLDHNGNVGVGLDTPLAKLNVLGDFRVDMSGSVSQPSWYTGPLITDTSFYAANGQVGVDNLSPTAALDVNGTVRFDSYQGVGIRPLGVDDLGNVVIMGGSCGGGWGGSSVWEGNSAGIDYAAGNVGINNTAPSYSLDVGGTIRAYSYLIVSDATLKDNVTSINKAEALSGILSLQPVTFNWKTGTPVAGNADMGFLAQDVENVFPQLVHTDLDGTKSVEYANLLAPMVAAVQELNDEQKSFSCNEYQGQIDSVEAAIQTNAATLTSMDSQIADLQTAMAALQGFTGSSSSVDVDAAETDGYYACATLSNDPNHTNIINDIASTRSAIASADGISVVNGMDLSVGLLSTTPAGWDATIIQSLSTADLSTLCNTFLRERIAVAAAMTDETYAGNDTANPAPDQGQGQRDPGQGSTGTDSSLGRQNQLASLVALTLTDTTNGGGGQENGGGSELETDLAQGSDICDNGNAGELTNEQQNYICSVYNDAVDLQNRINNPDPNRPVGQDGQAQLGILTNYMTNFFNDGNVQRAYVDDQGSDICEGGNKGNMPKQETQTLCAKWTKADNSQVMGDESDVISYLNTLSDIPFFQD